MQRSAGKAQGVFRAILTPPFRYFWRIGVEGLDNVPDSGGAIIAPNHISVIDSFFVPLVLPRRITYVGKAEYMDSWKTRYLFPAMGMVPIDRGGGDAAKAALDTAADVLGAGELFGIYPEGTRARDGLLHKGHTGVARLAMRTGCPIIPVGIIGTREIQPPDAPVPKPFRRAHIRFGRPIDPERYSHRSDDRIALRQITDEVMFEVAALSGQQYVDTYATKPKVVEQPEVPEVAVPAVEPQPAAAALEGSGKFDAVVDLDEHRRRRDEVAEPAAAFAPSVAHPSPQEAASMAATSEEADGVERRSSTAVLQSRPLVGA